MGANPALALLRRLTGFADALRRDGPKNRTGKTDEDLGDVSPDDQSERQRPQGGLIWVHGDTIQDVIPFRGLVPRLSNHTGEAFTPLVTTSDRPHPPIEDAIHQPAPADTLPSVNRFLDYWHPDIGVFIGDQLPPTLVHSARSRGIPLLWLNAAWEKGAKRWRPSLNTALVGCFVHIVPKTPEHARALRQLGVDADRLDPPGVLQEDAVALSCDEAERNRFAAQLATRPVWLAAPVALHELPAIEAAHRHAARQSHRLLLIVVPETATDTPEVARLFERRGWSVAIRSTAILPEAETQVFIADTPDELGLWYRLAPITFIARTLEAPGGGTTPFDAAALGSAILHGPHVGRHRQRFDRLARAGAAQLVQSGADLGRAVENLLAADKAAAMAEAAWRVTSEGAEVSDRVFNALCAILDPEGDAA